MLNNINLQLFSQDYDQLKAVTLNPLKHTASNAHEHCEMVATRVAELARLNECTQEETAQLQLLARVHDIGKICGNANPQSSLDLLSRYGYFDDGFIALVKFHDINLSWYIAMQKGQPPGDKAWNKLNRNVDIRQLCIFMIADRVDCPGGWEKNDALVWFLAQIKQRGYLKENLQY